MTNYNGTYRQSKKGKEQEEKPKPISQVGGGRGGSLIAFSQGVGVANGR